MKISPLLATLVIVLAHNAHGATLAGPLTNNANGHHYFLLASSSWSAAEVEAVSLGGHLVTINDPAEQAWVYETFIPLALRQAARPGLWIGLYDPTGSNHYSWISGEPVDFTHWANDGEPNNPGIERYVHMIDPQGAPGDPSHWNNASGHSTDGLVTLFGVVEVASPVTATCIPSPAGQIAWWPGEANGLAAKGAFSGRTRHGVDFIPGVVGQAFLFDGATNYVGIPDHPALSPHAGASGEMTLEAWVRVERLPQRDPATGQDRRAIVAKANPNQWEYALNLLTNGTPQFLLWNNLSSGNYGCVTGGSVSLGTWHHIAGIVCKGSFMRLYVDGTQVAETNQFTGGTTNGTSNLWIGRRGDGQNFDGAVDEVALYNRALSSNEISAIHTAGSIGQCPPAYISLAQSDFETPQHGWSIYDADPSNPPTVTWVNTGGNPSGFLRVDEYGNGDGDTTYWNAPAMFLGNKSGAFGGLLEFDLRQNDIENQFDSPRGDIYLRGAGMILVADSSYNPLTNWRPYRIPLSPEFWHRNDLNGPVATAEELLRVLSNLKALQIRAEYREGNDIDDLDNVRLRAPACVSSTLLATRHLSASLWVIEWPANACGFVLEESDSITHPDWRPISSPVVQQNGLKAIHLSDGVRFKFFRLRKDLD